MKFKILSFFIVLTALSITIPKELFAENLSIDTELTSPFGDYHTIRTTSTTQLTLDAGKNVVIGKVSDAATGKAKLYVAGNARINGKIRSRDGFQAGRSGTDSGHAEGALWLKA